MPIKSSKQFRFMEAAAHRGLRGLGGPSKGVAEEFLDKTPESKKSQYAKENFSKSLKKKK